MTDQARMYGVDNRLIARRRTKRRIHLVVDSGILVVGVVLAVAATGFPSLLDIQNPTVLLIATVALFAIGAYAWWGDLRTIRGINAVFVAESGFSPPFKPKQRLSRGDWFVPYGDIVSMLPVSKRKGFVPAYDITLRDGLTFQLNALDLLLYVDEKEVRRYAKMLAIIKEEIERPENRAKVERGEDVAIPGVRFEATAANPSGLGVPARLSTFWYFVLIGLVAGFVAAMIIGFAVLR